LTYRRCIRFRVQSFKPRDFVCFNFLITIMVASSNKPGGSTKNKGSRSQKNRQNDEEGEGLNDSSGGGGIVRLGGGREGLLAQVVVVAGTYDGVLAGWEYNGGDSKEEGDEEIGSDRIQLKIRFASPIHNGSVRCLALNTTKSLKSKGSSGGMCLSPGMLVSVGFDDVIKLHDFRRHQTSRGEVRTPSEWGTPIVAALAPPSCATHCLVGFVTGKILIYATKDWSVQHVLSGHSSSTSASSTTSTCGVASLSVHPSGKLALSGGLNDGKLMLWDLTKGRLAHVNKVDATTKASLSSSKRLYEPIACIVWGQYGAGHEMYGYCYGNHITVRDVATGRELLDVELPSRVHQICFLGGGGGGGADKDHAGVAFVAAACDDGSLPVLAVEELDDNRQQGDGHVRRAVMAIEPVIPDEGGQGGDGRHSAGEERFKCIQAVSSCHVVTANSAGVVSLMDLSGALRMLLEPPGDDEEGSDDGEDQDGDSSDASADKDHARKNGDDDDDEEEELAVDILDSVRLGSGARITCLAAWATHLGAESPLEDEDDTAEVEQTSKSNKRVNESRDNISHESNPKRKRGEVELDPSALEKARKLVSKAKKIQKRKRDKTQKKARAD
jgi:WD40 repeat protein